MQQPTKDTVTVQTPAKAGDVTAKRFTIEPQTAPIHSGAAPSAEGMTAAQFQKHALSAQPPTNTQLVGGLQHADQLLRMREAQATNPETIRIAEDARRLVEDTQRLVVERNQGEQMQHIMMHQRELAKEKVAHAGGQEGLMQKARDQAAHARTKMPGSQDARARLQSARNFIMLLVRSPEFRESITELMDLLRQVVEVGPRNINRNSAGVGQQTANIVREVIVETTFDRPVMVQQPGMVEPTMAQTVVTNVPIAGTTTGTATSMNTADIRRRLVAILQRFSNNAQYRDGVNNLLRMLSQVNRQIHDRAPGEKLDSAKQRYYSNEHMTASLAEAKSLLMGFTGGRSPDPLFNHFRNLNSYARNHPDLRTYFHELRVYFKEGLQNPVVFEDEARMDSFINRGRALQQDMRYNESTQGIFYESRELLAAIRSDPVASKFSTDLNRLVSDIFMNDETGRPTFKPQALNALREIIMGMFIDELKYFPIPNMSGSDGTMEWAISDINMTLFDLLPEDIIIKNYYKGHFLPTNLTQAASNVAQSRGMLKVIIHKRDTRIDNIHYWFRRLKTPRLEDSGIAAVDITRGGITIKLYLETRMGSKYDSFFLLRDVRVRIGKMRLSLRESKYRFLLALFKPIVNRQMKTRTETAIRDAIWNNANTMQSRLHRTIENLSMRSNNPAVADRLGQLERLIPVTHWTERQGTGTSTSYARPYVPAGTMAQPMATTAPVYAQPTAPGAGYAISPMAPVVTGAPVPVATTHGHGHRHHDTAVVGTTAAYPAAPATGYVVSPNAPVITPIAPLANQAAPAVLPSGTTAPGVLPPRV